VCDFNVQAANYVAKGWKILTPITKLSKLNKFFLFIGNIFFAVSSEFATDVIGMWRSFTCVRKTLVEINPPQ
jgi:hypothetical protein